MASTLSILKCNMTNELHTPIVSAVRGSPSLEELYLYSNQIGSAGCEILAQLLEHPNSKLHILSTSEKPYAIMWCNNNYQCIEKK